MSSSKVSSLDFRSLTDSSICDTFNESDVSEEFRAELSKLVILVVMELKLEQSILIFSLKSLFNEAIFMLRLLRFFQYPRKQKIAEKSQH